MLDSNELAYRAAWTEAKKIRLLVLKFRRSEIDSPEWFNLHRQITKSVKPGFYQHWKSGDGRPTYYRVDQMHLWSNAGNSSCTFHVSFVAMYGRREGLRQACELLGKNGFLTPIRRAQYTGPRFVYAGAKVPPEKRPRLDKQTTPQK
jgi:hypothetical protein